MPVTDNIGSLADEQLSMMGIENMACAGDRHQLGTITIDVILHAQKTLVTGTIVNTHCQN